MHVAINIDLAEFGKEIAPISSKVTRTEQKKAKESNKLKRGFYRGTKEEAEINYHKKYGVGDANGKSYPVLFSSLDVFNAHGESLRIYFSFLRMFVYCFLACGALASFNSYLNFTGYYLNDFNSNSVVDRISLANIYGFPNDTTNATAATWVQDVKTTKEFYYFFDLSYTCLIIWCVFAFKVFSHIIRKAIY